MSDRAEKLDIIQFCRDPDFLNLPLLDTQEVLLRQIYRLPMSREQHDLWAWMQDARVSYRDPDRTKGPYREIVLILGGRSSKTTLAGAMTCYEICCRDWSKYVRKGELAWVFVIATREKQAIDLGRNVIFSMIRNSPVLSTLIVEDSNDTHNTALYPRTRSGVLVLDTGVAVTALPCSSRVGRGYPVCGLVMDELAWFARESKNEATDQGIYDAVTPRQLQFGPMAFTLLISTPADQSGLLYDRWKNRDRRDGTNVARYFIVKLPTWKMRTDLPQEYFARFKSLSPYGYVREFGAEFTDAVDPFIRMNEVTPCIRTNPDGTYSNESVPPKKDVNYVMAIDTAFGERDRFAISIGHVENADDETNYYIVIDHSEIVEETIEDTSLVEAGARRVKELYDQYEIFEVYGDEHQADAFGKILEDRGVNLTTEPWTARKHRLGYGLVRDLIKQKKLSLPGFDELVDELVRLQVRFLPTSGQYTVTHRPGGHDDVADTVADIVYHLTEDELISAGGVQMM